MMKKYSAFILMLVMGLVILGSVPTVPVFADNKEDIRELQRQIDERNENIKELEEEIAKYQAEVDKTSAVAMTLANKIKELEATGKKLDGDIRLTQQKISAANLEINKLSYDITDKEARINATREAIAENIRQLEAKDNSSIIQDFLNKRDISETWNSIVELFSLQNTLQNHIYDLTGTKAELQKDKLSEEERKSELSEFVTNLSGQKNVLAATKNEQTTLFNQTKNQEAEYQRIVAEKKKAKDTLEAELFEYESKLQYTLNPDSIPSKGSAALAWPLADVYITQQFGVTNASGRLYASGSHNGVDFRAPVGTAVKAMGNGVVIGTGDTDLTCKGASFGRWTLIKYDNNLSGIFAHLSVVSVKEGQKVTTGQVVGYSGNTGYSTGPHLHVGLYPGDAVKVEDRPSISCGGKVYRMPIAPVNAYLDPLAYLPKL